MKKIGSFKPSVLAAGVSGALLIANAAFAAGAVDITVSDSGVVIATTVDDNFIVMNVRIVDPDGFLIVDHRSLGEDVNWTLSAEDVDGEYRYEAVVVVQDANAEGGESLERATGRFKVEAGVVKPQEIPAPPVSLIDLKPGLFVQGITAVFDFLVPTAEAQNLTASSENPVVFFNDTTVAGAAEQAIWAFGDTAPFFGIYDNVDGHYWLQYFSSVSTGNGSNSIVVGPSGNLSFADFGMYFDRANRHLGIGTSLPAVDLQINDTSPELRFFDETDSRAMDLAYDGGKFAIEGHSGQKILSLTETSPENSITVDASGRVGLGTAFPDTKLEVTSTSGEAVVSIDENSGVAAKRYLLRMENNGATGFFFRDTSTADEWQFASTASGEFTASYLGTGGSEMIVRKTGEFQVGPGGSSKFRVTPTGRGYFAGTVYSLGIALISDRNIKENFSPVDPAEVLAKVNALDITRWNFKKNDPEVDHIGPMAQDFHKAFGLGADNKHISPMDMASVALAAVKGLQQELNVRDVEIAHQDAKLAQQDETIAELKRGQARMESMLQALMINAEPKSLPAVYAPPNTGL